MTDLGKCICGNKKPKVNFRLLIDPPKKVRKKEYQVTCMSCGVSGQNRINIKDAMDSWNSLVGKCKNSETVSEQETKNG